MLYYWLKYMMRLVLTVYYRRRVFSGFDNIPAEGPIIFACNHPNSFLDAMIIGAFIKRETHFLARSDVFNSPLKLWILSQFKLIPIYRLQEGVENLDKNKVTFERCHAIFRKGGAVLMFSEGLCIQEMRLRPLKKGTARIALEYSKDGAPLTIIPTGLNYLKPMTVREDIMISMDTPFNAADFAAEYNENNGKGIQLFNKSLLTGLQNTVIDIQDKKHDKEIVQLVEVEYNNGADLKKLVQQVKYLNEFPRQEWIASASDYKASLEKYKLDDRTVAGASGSMLWLLPALVVFGIAFWLFLLPVGLAIYLVDKESSSSRIQRLGVDRCLHCIYVCLLADCFCAGDYLPGHPARISVDAHISFAGAVSGSRVRRTYRHQEREDIQGTSRERKNPPTTEAYQRLSP